MTIDARCLVCRNADRRRLIELGWNGGMAAVTISNVLGGSPSGPAIISHLRKHADGEGHVRQVEVEPERPMRERVLAIQRMQVDEFERRIALAKQRAASLNAEHKDEEGFVEHDWAEFVDILGKDMQSAIGSILKTQGLSDRREKEQGDLKLGLFEAMANAGLAPKALIGGATAKPKLLSPGDDDDADD